MKIFENLFELSKGALPVCLVPSKKPTTKFLTLNSCWKVHVTFQYFAHFLWDELKGIIFCGNILGTLKLISAFLLGCLLAYSRRYDFQKIGIYLIFP